MEILDKIKRLASEAQGEIKQNSSNDDEVILRVKREIYDQCAVEMMRNILYFGLYMEERFADVEDVNRQIMSATYNMVVSFCEARFNIDARTLEKNSCGLREYRRMHNIDKSEQPF